MLRPTAPALIPTTLGVMLLLAGCSGTEAAPSPEPTLGPVTTTPSAAPDAQPGGGRLPSCDAIAGAMLGLVDGMAFDAATSLAQEAQEEYEQRVCVYRTADGAAALGITIAGIPFQQAEIDGYAERPNAIEDERTSPRSAALQTFDDGDGDDGILDSPLYLIDTAWSITIQGVAEGSSVAVALPQLTVPVAIDAAFSVRDLVG